MPRLRRVAFGVLLLVLSGVVFVNAAAAQAVKDPLKLFEPMYPVFSGERCANCHGDVDVVSGEGHPGGPIPGVKVDKDSGMCCDTKVNLPCAACHDEGAIKDDDGNVVGGKWKIAPPRMSFVGLDVKQMCKKVQKLNSLDPFDADQWNAFISHLEGDDLIGMAFEGKRGITDASPEGPVSAEPPPVDRASFVQMADRWLREGRARCGPWNGTISQTISRKLITPLTEDVLDAQIDIDVKDGDGTAHVKATGHTSSKGQACESQRDDFKVDVQNIPVELTILVNSDMLGQVGLPGGIPAPSNLPPGVPVPNFGPDGYTLIVRVTSDIKGSDHFERHSATSPTACSVSTGDHDWPFQPAFGEYMKQINPDEPDHLKDADTVTIGSDTATTTWDLTR